jgi:hypothetical protein
MKDLTHAGLFAVDCSPHGLDYYKNLVLLAESLLLIGSKARKEVLQLFKGYGSCLSLPVVRFGDLKAPAL